MNIHMYASAQSIAADLLRVTVTVPEHWIGGHRYRERRYGLEEVMQRVSDSPVMGQIAMTALTDQAEAGRLLNVELRKQAAELAAELFAEHCTESA